MSGTDVVIDPSVEQGGGFTGRNQVTVSATLSYFFYGDVGGISWRKTTDGGLTWSAPTDFSTESETSCLDTYYARWTSAGAPNVVYITWDDNTVAMRQRYAVFDIATETITVPETTIHTWTGSASFASTISIVYNRDGSLRATGYKNTGIGAGGWTGRSTDGGTTWVDDTGQLTEDVNDQILLWPDFTGATSSSLALFWDYSAQQISGKQTDGTTVTETAIVSGVEARQSDIVSFEQSNWSSTITTAGLILLAVCNRFSASPMTITTYTVSGATVTQAGNVITAGAYVSSPFLCIDANATIYCFYARDPLGASLDEQGLYYKASTDVMLTWGAEVESSDGTDYGIIYGEGDPRPVELINPIWYSRGPEHDLYTTANPITVPPVPPAEPPPDTIGSIILRALYMEGVDTNSSEIFMPRAPAA